MEADKETLCLRFDDADEVKKVMAAIERIHEGCYIMGTLAELYGELHKLAGE